MTIGGTISVPSEIAPSKNAKNTPNTRASASPGTDAAARSPPARRRSAWPLRARSAARRRARASGRPSAARSAGSTGRAPASDDRASRGDAASRFTTAGSEHAADAQTRQQLRRSLPRPCRACSSRHADEQHGVGAVDEAHQSRRRRRAACAVGFATIARTPTSICSSGARLARLGHVDRPARTRIARTSSAETANSPR